VLGSLCHELQRSRSPRVRSRESRAGRALRRPVLHGRADDAHLLPANVSGEARQVAQRRVLRHGGGRRARRLSSVPALPTPAPAPPACGGAAASVSRAVRLIERGFLDDGRSVDELADTLGMTARHLRRLFRHHAGASPTAVATTRRVQRAKTLIDETTLPMSAGGLAAGGPSHPPLQPPLFAPVFPAPRAVAPRPPPPPSAP